MAKFVPFVKQGLFESRLFYLQMIEASPAGQSIGQMRKRIKIVDKLKEAKKNGVMLDDSEQAELVQVINSRHDFVATSKEVIAAVDALENAKDKEG